MAKPLLLDLFCGAGGCSVGYALAGFDVVGVDIAVQSRYPFPFVQDDAIAFLRCLLSGGTSSGYRLQDFQAIHASPPCQRYTCLRSVFDASRYHDLIEPVRELLSKQGRPWVIENVPGAPIRSDLVLCAAAFGLRSYRHRLFECSFPVVQPPHPPHTVRVNRRKINRRGHWDAGGFVTVTGDIGSYVGPEAMGIGWMTGAELSQAIPPAYTQLVGEQLMRSLQTRG